MPRAELRAQFAPARMKFLLVAAGGFAAFAASADLAVKLLYDERYQAATWMLPVLVSGAWFTILANLNESSLLGLGRPNFNVLANCAKLVFIVVGMMAAVPRYGVFGGVLIVAASDLCRYGPVFYGQVREGFSFGRQDLLATAAVIAGIAFFQWMRWLAGFGVSYDIVGRLWVGLRRLTHEDIVRASWAAPVRPRRRNRVSVDRRGIGRVRRGGDADRLRAEARRRARMPICKRPPSRARALKNFRACPCFATNMDGRS